MTELDAFESIHRAQAALSLYRERRAAHERCKPRTWRPVKWNAKHWRPYWERAWLSLWEAAAHDVGRRDIFECLREASWAFMDGAEYVTQLLLDTAERLLREHLEEKRVG